MFTPLPFNAVWYLGQNPDVAAAVNAGLTDAQTHFNQFGRAEGRSASPISLSAKHGRLIGSRKPLLGINGRTIRTRVGAPINAF